MAAKEVALTSVHSFSLEAQQLTLTIRKLKRTFPQRLNTFKLFNQRSCLKVFRHISSTWSKPRQALQDIFPENNNVISLEKRNLRDPVCVLSKTVMEEVQGTYPQKIRQTEAESLNRAIHCANSWKHTKG